MNVHPIFPAVCFCVAKLKPNNGDSMLFRYVMYVVVSPKLVQGIWGEFEQDPMIL